MRCRLFAPLNVAGCLVLLSLSLLLGSIWLSYWALSDNTLFLLKHAIRILLLLFSLLSFMAGISFFIRKLPAGLVKNLLTLPVAFFVFFIVGEIIFSLLPISTGGGKILATKNWFNLYWRENRLGYRDEDPFTIDNPQHENIFIIGDSYVAGHGIADEDQRFSELLELKLDSCIDIFNIAKPGANTPEEYIFLEQFPLKPDMIILVHVHNDIYTPAAKQFISKELMSDALDKQITTIRATQYKLKLSENFLIARSFFLNFIDYLIKNIKRDLQIATYAKKFGTFEQFLYSDRASGLEMTYYKNDTLFNRHLRNLDKFISYSRKHHIPLLVLLFPKLDDEIIRFSDEIANKPIARYLETKAVPVINLTSYVQNIRPQQRRAGKFDPHPSEVVHQKIAMIIEDYFKASGLLRKFCL